ncbi:MAG: branched-chain amino acid ABC transporter permease [Rhodospirillaceae bacterium]|jgi:branched-chain amino acid transport system permease protein|nr:branched-chain amino acid ABC transporter permease [Rhodospirillaceae bacterium]MBT5242729.1 branched-chain amino acid ABC transporter permease [Rhodospirillaceae bacterium]MBT5561542.1 branched-chain amino acid ABC transporter permease [Rhodospirillaceae bacterium]MBT6241860.1 branched-chain amino acid ABC transporter permease [Rhodospirillaceae bacterium]MBT7138661.1 branched-chain amino acid ABC transporter permease [Rhodospirillaceae bacterium]
MYAEFLQFLFSGITVGAIYALVGLGFAIIYNASNVINFAQGEFVMLGGMGTVFFIGLGLPMPIAVLLAIALTVVVGFGLEKLAVEPARDAPIVTLIIITIGASIFLRGAAQLVWDRNFHSVDSFSGSDPIMVAGASILPQSLWILCSTVVIVIALHMFFTRSMTGKAIIATSHNPLAAKLMGIDTSMVLLMSFGLSALLGASAGILIAPISLTYTGVGIMLGLKGFCAAVLGGLGKPMGAIAGGLLVGISEAMTAGYISSAYKDAVAFIIILAVLFLMPNGLFGGRGTERV